MWSCKELLEIYFEIYTIKNFRYLFERFSLLTTNLEKFSFTFIDINLSGKIARISLSLMIITENSIEVNTQSKLLVNLSKRILH